jgi:transcriptional regulator with XRE-family HTH domain
MKGFKKAKRRVALTSGQSVRMMRELQALTQPALEALTGISQSSISGIENDRVPLGLERAKVLAKALRCHPAVLAFPGWNIEAA